jgi:benzoyl-CoA reductase subunit BamC
MKKIKIDQQKCTGCRNCETACSLNHCEDTVNPQKSRIRVYMDEEKDIFYPLIAGPFTEAECTSKLVVNIDGKDHDECTLCRASCPSRPWFKEPDTHVSLKCDFCGDPPDPQCVQICTSGALSLVEV